VLYDYSAQPLSPRAIVLSFDNQQAVVADASGKIVNITLSSNASTVTDCGCSPEGLYGLGGAVFRLTGHGVSGRNESHTELKLFDAASGAVLIVPPALSEAGGRQ